MTTDRERSERERAYDDGCRDGAVEERQAVLALLADCKLDPEVHAELRAQILDGAHSRRWQDGGKDHG